MDDKERYGTLTDAEIDAFDEEARRRFEQGMPGKSADPAPGSDEARELVRDAIRQGGEWVAWKYEPVKPEPENE